MHIELREYGRILYATVTSVLFPAQCSLCDEAADVSSYICRACYTQLQHIADPVCVSCGTPFPYVVEDNTTCIACVDHPPAYAKARAALQYNHASSALISRFKYADATYLSTYLGQILYRAAQPLLDDIDIIMPVPLHRRRLRQRKYNQSMLLAQYLAKTAHKPCLSHILRRQRHTAPQTSLDMEARQHNVAGAFCISSKGKNIVHGKRVLLVDDVITTGATINACSYALTQAGASCVNVAAIAKRVLDADNSGW